MNRILPLFAMLSVLASAPAVEAALIVGNITQTAIGATIFGSPDQRVAAQFNLGPTVGPQVLSSAVLRLAAEFGDTTAGVEIYSNSGNHPGTVLADLGTTLVSGTSAANYAFTSLSSLVLNPATSYWIVLRVAGGSNLTWFGSSTLSGYDTGSLPGTSITVGYDIRFGAGGGWSAVPPAGRMMLQIQGTPVTAVPEPSSIALAGFGGLGLALIGLRRRGRA